MPIRARSSRWESGEPPSFSVSKLIEDEAHVEGTRQGVARVGRRLAQVLAGPGRSSCRAAVSLPRCSTWTETYPQLAQWRPRYS